MRAKLEKIREEVDFILGRHHQMSDHVRGLVPPLLSTKAKHIQRKRATNELDAAIEKNKGGLKEIGKIVTKLIELLDATSNAGSALHTPNQAVRSRHVAEQMGPNISDRLMALKSRSEAQEINRSDLMVKSVALGLKFRSIEGMKHGPCDQAADQNHIAGQNSGRLEELGDEIDVSDSDDQEASYQDESDPNQEQQAQYHHDNKGAEQENDGRRAADVGSRSRSWADNGRDGDPLEHLRQQNRNNQARGAEDAVRLAKPKRKRQKVRVSESKYHHEHLSLHWIVTKDGQQVRAAVVFVGLRQHWITKPQPEWRSICHKCPADKNKLSEKDPGMVIRCKTHERSFHFACLDIEECAIEDQSFLLPCCAEARRVAAERRDGNQA